jgi:ribonuclease VapC
VSIFLDASALVAIIAGEIDADDLARQIDEDPVRLISAISRWETIVSLHRSHKFDWHLAQRNMDELAERLNFQLVSIGELESQLALSTFSIYGKGNHPAGLNMGDCFAYACAAANEARLVYKGNDFSRTNLDWIYRA